MAFVKSQAKCQIFPNLWINLKIFHTLTLHHALNLLSSCGSYVVNVVISFLANNDQNLHHRSTPYFKGYVDSMEPKGCSALV